ncbi:PAS domain S-box protein [Bradyrhizobium tropiciagri]|uniref:PAS domain S-box protein n=1 Tax=Bradyrhizobium tropiciagri TaxID=312253 RepID=UPI00067A9FF8|nr:PAS domain S-box protein [Bradyrhizobium tropiciagri]
MVPHSQNVANVDGGSQVLWRDGERVFHRGWRLDDEGKRCAVLLIVPATEHPSRSTFDRFSHEYELKDELDSTWAVRPLELVREANRTVLVLDDAGGEPLEMLLGVPMDIGRFLRLGSTIASVVGKLHRRGLIHKDIKPANILLNGVTGEVKLTGFGIASRFERERQSPHPPEMIAGTLAYMAPEQTGRMNRSIDSRSDLYALGITFYQMLTGALPFVATEPKEWVHCHLARQPVPPAERLKEIPGAVSTIVMKLLAKRAEDRYQTAAGLESDLCSCLIEWEARGRIDDFPLGENDTSDRLRIPEKLYGRKREVETLLASFDRIVNGGAPELVLVYGYSGIGKSSVVNELQSVLVPPRGLFASGKFDQLKRDIPYATLAQALQSLIRPLLGKSDADLASWRDALWGTLGSNAGLMADLVPELKHLMGELPPVVELPPQDAQRRFQTVLRQLIGVFARPEHPLALFLDDLQWLDAATLDLLEDLLSRSDLRNLLLIGAFRDNEVTVTHPLMRKLQAIRATGRVRDIKLAPLATSDLGNLVADSLRCNPEQTNLLAGLVHAKTDGNPLFAIQFLHVLADEGLLAFDQARVRWSWDTEGIRAKRYTDNVVELLAEKLNRLSPGTQDALRQLACLGSVVDVAILSAVLNKPEELVHAAFSEAISQQLIDRVAGSYKFIHDRVQEAAYALIPEASRAEAHLTIGRLLLAQTAPEKRDEAIFEIVNQLNRGALLISSSEEREQLARLNLIAGKRAKTSTAYGASLRYFTTGAATLPEDSWERRRELMFELELHRAECEFLTGELAAAENRLTLLSARTANTVERAAAACLRIDVYAARGRMSEAVAVGLEFLQHVGVAWSAHPADEEVRREYQRIWSKLGGRAIEELVDLPLMTDPASLAILDVLSKLGPAAVFTDANLLALVGCGAVSLSLDRGNSDGSSNGYVRLGMVAGPLFGDYRAGYRFGRVGYELVERRDLKHFLARIFMNFGNQVLPWTRHARSGRDLLHRAFDVANKTGDLTYAAYSRAHLNSNMLMVGDPLDEVQRETEQGLALAQQMQFELVTEVIATQLALVRMLRGSTPRFGSFDDEQFDEGRIVRHLSGDRNLAFAECWYWIRKLQGSFLAGDFSAAVEASLRAQRLIWTSLPAIEFAEYHFYSALARASSCDSASPNRRRDHLEALAAHYEQIGIWAENCRENFENRAALVGAEIARLEGRELDAERLYQRAINSARANGFVHNEALACELTARFYAARGFEDIAQLYLGNARRSYLKWGAAGKVRQLDQLHPRLGQDEPARGPAGTIEAPVEHLDLATMIEVSQALSGEMVLEKLIDKLMRAAIEHAGAERGLLIIPRGDELQIQAEAIASGENVIVHLGDGSCSLTALPESVVRYGTRTHQTVILDDASSRNPFSGDSYILQGRVRSVLCLPLINQGKLAAILYLENHLAPNVFTPDRVALLKVLASQAAISLENSRLYHDLADREGKIRRLVDANIIGIIIRNREGQILEANDAFLRIVGYDREDLALGRVRWAELNAPEWRERDQLTGVQLNSTGIAPPFEKEYVRKDGSRVPVLVGAATFNEGGDEGVGFVLDLTERKRAEQAVQLRTTLDSIPAMAWRTRVDGSTEYINKRWLDYTGISLDQALGWQWFALIHPDDAPRLRDAWLQTLASEKPGEAEARMRGSDGSYRWFLIRAEPVRDEAGAVVAWYGTNTDIQDLKTAESALRRSEAELANVRHVQQTLDSIPVAAWRARADGSVEYFNKRMLDYTGNSIDRALSWQRTGSIHPEDLPRVNDLWLQLLASEKPGEIEARIRRHDGSYRWFLIRAEPSRDDTGRVVAWYGTHMDIDDRRQALAQLQQMQSDFAHMNRVSMMGELAASLSHEIAQPIASARNNARAAENFLNMQPPDLDEVREALSCLVADADRSGEIIDRIREQIKKAPPRKERFDLNTAINEVTALAQSVTLKNGVSVQIRFAEGLLPVLGDRVQLQQVLLNLVLNAAEAMGSIEEGRENC